MKSFFKGNKIQQNGNWVLVHPSTETILVPIKSTVLTNLWIMGILKHCLSELKQQ